MSGSGIAIDFPEASANPTPCRLEMRIKLERIVATEVSASLSADTVLRENYNATVDVLSLKETEDVSVRVRIWRKKSLEISALR